MPEKKFPAALPAPDSDVTELTTTLVDAAIVASRNSPRRRVIQPLHKQPEATLHRMLNVLQPDTYVRAHWHVDPPKDESLVVLAGGVRCVVFDLSGNVLSVHNLYAGSELFGIDLQAGVIHTLICLEEDTVLYEVKPGPYAKVNDKAFMEWAPEEGTPEAAVYLQQLRGQTE